MIRFLLGRLFSSVVALFLFTIIVFFAFNVLIPYDYVTTLAMVLNHQQMAELRELLGLDLPVWRQYLNWLGNLVQGNLGQEYTIAGRGRAVTDLMTQALPATLLVFVSGSFLAFWVGQWLGKVSGWFSGRRRGGALTLAAILFYTAFPPILAFLLGYLFKDMLGLLPLSSHMFANRLWQQSVLTPWEVMGRLVLLIFVAGLLTSLLARGWRNRRQQRLLRPLPLAILATAAVLLYIWRDGYLPFVADIALVAFVPFLTYLLLAYGDTMLIMQNRMRDLQYEPYVQTARAKGLPLERVRDAHAAPNAVLPVISRFMVNLPYMLTAIVIVEHATGWPGIGNLFFNAIYDQNTYLYMGIVVIVGLITLVARLLLDLAHAYLDPRIRFGRRSTPGG